MATLYEKHGRRYYAAAETETMNSYPLGTHIVRVTPGWIGRRFNIPADFDALDAALEEFSGDLQDALREALTMRPESRLLTARQVKAWGALRKALGGGACALETPSIAEAVQTAIDAFRKRIRERPCPSSSTRPSEGSSQPATAAGARPAGSGRETAAVAPE